MKDISTQQVGLIVKNYRKQAGFTQFQLAELIGIDDKQLGKIERGVHFPSVPTFLKLLNVLQINIDEFYSGGQTLAAENSNKLIRLIRNLSTKQCDKVFKIIKILISD